MRRRYPFWVHLTAIALLAAACGNSSDDVADEQPVTTEADADPPETTLASEEEVSTDDTGADAATEVPGDEPASDNSTFVALDGVQGVTDDEIAVAVIGTKENNPLGTCILDCYVTGIQAYFDMINANGGIYGRDFVISNVLDDALVQNSERTLEVIAGEEHFAVFGATLIASGWGDLNDAGIPLFVWNIHAAESNNREGIFGHFIIGCPTCSQRQVPWLTRESGSSQVASLGYGVSETSKVCASAVSDSVDKYSEDLGIEMAYFNDDIAFGLPNGIGPEVTAMIEAGVDFVSTCLDLNAMLTLAQEFERQNYRDEVVLFHPNTYDNGFVANAGSLFDGDLVAPQFAAFEYEVESALLDSYNEFVPANGGPQAEQTMVGWINADQLVTGLIAAGPEFSQGSVIDGLNAGVYEAEGLINPIDFSTQHVPPVEGSPDNDYSVECSTAVQMQDGAFVPFMQEAFMCWSNETLDWSEPVPMNFG